MVVSGMEAAVDPLERMGDAGTVTHDLSGVLVVERPGAGPRAHDKACGGLEQQVTASRSALPSFLLLGAPADICQRSLVF